jgi:DNA-binding HxlR family transcriptional regulator
MENTRDGGQYPSLCGDMIGVIRDKWSLRLMYLLSPAPLRFSELLRQSSPISHKMLSQSLRDLERYGLVKRSVTAKIPLQVSYHVTPLGCGFLDLVGRICHWTVDNLTAIQDAMEAFDAAVVDSRLPKPDGDTAYDARGSRVWAEREGNELPV